MFLFLLAFSARAALPVAFEPAPVAGFQTHTRAWRVELTAREVVWRNPRTSVAMRFGSARLPIAESPLPGRSHYFLGRDPARWRTNVPQFARLRYPHLYPGIDLVFRGSPDALEYDFMVAPGADPARIRLEFHGARPRIAAGDLVLATAGGEIRHRRPVAFQDRAGRRITVPARWEITARGARFRLGPYDHALPLVIDPALVYLTYAGGAGADAAAAVAVDSTGSAYVAGFTWSATSTVFAAFVTKLNPQGTAAVYSTYLGGDKDSFGNAIAVDSAGNAYVAGGTNSLNSFPTTPNTYQSPGGLGFAAKLSPAGALLWSSIVKPAVEAMAVDSSGNAYLTGATASDAFVMKLAGNASRLIYSTSFGGSAEESAHAIAVDDAGNAYVTGETASSDFPVTPNAFQPAFHGRGDAFVAKLDPAGARLLYASYLGGAAPDAGKGIAVDRAGNFYVAGATSSSDFPTTGGALQGTYGGGDADAFVTKFSASGEMVYATFLGGTALDSAAAIAVDSAGNAYITGNTDSAGFPRTDDALPTCRTAGGIFLSELNPTGSALVHSTLLGGLGLDQAAALALDSKGAAYVAGLARSQVFLSTPGALQTRYGGGDSDAFAAKVDFSAPSGRTVACVVNAASLQAGNTSFFPLGTVAPGEIVSLFGSGLDGTRVLFDGIPAPVLYMQSNQVNAVVPYGIKSDSTALTIERDGATTGPIALPVAPAVPGIFTLNGSGKGLGAILNQDGSVNSIANPAARGSVVVLYATGAGLLDPPFPDGAIAPLSLPLPVPRLPVSVTMRGAPAKVLYAGAAPGFISGAIQINVEVPQDAGFGNAVPLSVSVGDYASQFQVGIAIK